MYVIVLNYLLQGRHELGPIYGPFDTEDSARTWAVAEFVKHYRIESLNSPH